MRFSPCEMLSENIIHPKYLTFSHLLDTHLTSTFIFKKDDRCPPTFPLCSEQYFMFYHCTVNIKSNNNNNGQTEMDRQTEKGTIAIAIVWQLTLKSNWAWHWSIVSVILFEVTSKLYRVSSNAVVPSKISWHEYWRPLEPSDPPDRYGLWVLVLVEKRQHTVSFHDMIFSASISHGLNLIKWMKLC